LGIDGLDYYIIEDVYVHLHTHNVNALETFAQLERTLNIPVYHSDSFYFDFRTIFILSVGQLLYLDYRCFTVTFLLSLSLNSEQYKFESHDQTR